MGSLRMEKKPQRPEPMGVSVAFLERYLLWIKSKGSGRCSTEQVVYANKWGIAEMTKDHNASFIDLFLGNHISEVESLLSVGPGEAPSMYEVIKPATHFVCHAYEDLFEHMVEALVRQEQLTHETNYYWINIFSAQLDELSSHQVLDTVVHAIHMIKHVVLILHFSSLTQDPEPIERLWCFCELLIWAGNKSKRKTLTLALTPQANVIVEEQVTTMLGESARGLVTTKAGWDSLLFFLDDVNLVECSASNQQDAAVLAAFVNHSGGPKKACETVQAALNKAGPASVASAVAEQSVQIMKSGGVSANTAIQHLSISWDLVGQYITFLDFENCELGRVDDVLVLIDTMTQMANLQKLNLAGNFLQDVSAFKIADALNSTLLQVTWLDVRENFFSAAGAKALASAINSETFSRWVCFNGIVFEDFKNAETLDLRRTKFGVEGALVLAAFLGRNHLKNLTELDVRHNNIAGPGAEALAKVVLASSSSWTLYNKLKLAEMTVDQQGHIMELTGKRIGLDGLLILCNALVNARSVEHINLAKNDLGGFTSKLGTSALSKFLQRRSSVKVLDLSHNELQEYDMELLANALSLNRTVTQLNLTGNPFGDSGLEHLAGVIKHRVGAPQNTSIKDLDVRDCNITHFGGRMLTESVAATPIARWQRICGLELSEMLRKNPKELKLSKQRLGDCGVMILAHWLVHGPVRTKRIDLTDNGVTQLGLENLASCMIPNKRAKFCGTVETLIMNKNPIVGRASATDPELLAGIRAMCTVVEKNGSLRFIRLADTHCGKNAAKLIAGSLLDNKTLEQINFKNCHCEHEGMIAFVDPCNVWKKQHNFTLNVVNFEGNQMSKKTRRFMDDTWFINAKGRCSRVTLKISPMGDQV